MQVICTMRPLAGMRTAPGPSAMLSIHRSLHVHPYCRPLSAGHHAYSQHSHLQQPQHPQPQHPQPQHSQPQTSHSGRAHTGRAQATCAPPTPGKPAVLVKLDENNNRNADVRLAAVLEGTCWMQATAAAHLSPQPARSAHPAPPPESQQLGLRTALAVSPSSAAASDSAGGRPPPLASIAGERVAADATANLIQSDSTSSGRARFDTKVTPPASAETQFHRHPQSIHTNPNTNPNPKPNPKPNTQTNTQTNTKLSPNSNIRPNTGLNTASNPSLNSNLQRSPTLFTMQHQSSAYEMSRPGMSFAPAYGFGCLQQSSSPMQMSGVCDSAPSPSWLSSRSSSSSDAQYTQMGDQLNCSPPPSHGSYYGHSSTDSSGGSSPTYGMSGGDSPYDAYPSSAGWSLAMDAGPMHQQNHLGHPAHSDAMLLQPQYQQHAYGQQRLTDDRSGSDDGWPHGDLSSENESFVLRRNERERSRVKCVNDGFEMLREHLPVESNKRLSKLQTLKKAMDYIRQLEQQLETDSEQEDE